jgi:hypothetical protein
LFGQIRREANEQIDQLGFIQTAFLNPWDSVLHTSRLGSSSLRGGITRLATTNSDILMIGMTGYPAHDDMFLSQRNLYEY